VVPFLDRACARVKESVEIVGSNLVVPLRARITEDIHLPDVVQNVAQRLDIAQKHLVQPVQSRNGLRRDSIIVEFAKTNLDGLCVNQRRSKLLFNEFQNIFHPYSDATSGALMLTNFSHPEVTCAPKTRPLPFAIKHCHPEAKDSSRQLRKKSIHLPQNICLVRVEDIMVGMR
jgi:hypothetical protein